MRGLLPGPWVASPLALSPPPPILSSCSAVTSPLSTSCGLLYSILSHCLPALSQTNLSPWPQPLGLASPSSAGLGPLGLMAVPVSSRSQLKRPLLRGSSQAQAPSVPVTAASTACLPPVSLLSRKSAGPGPPPGTQQVLSKCLLAE